MKKSNFNSKVNVIVPELPQHLYKTKHVPSY